MNPLTPKESATFEREFAEIDRIVGVRIDSLDEGIWTVAAVSPAPLRILPADEPTPEKRDWFSLFYGALAAIGAMAVFVWGAKAVLFLVRYAR